MEYSPYRIDSHRIGAYQIPYGIDSHRMWAYEILMECRTDLYGEGACAIPDKIDPSNIDPYRIDPYRIERYSIDPYRMASHKKNV